eukprot:XP_013997128.1 PREDICTED: uncharacterized protein LOC106569918 isoform X3 [Salmo salar]
MESDTEMEDFDSSEEESNWSDDSYLADEDFSFDYQEGVDAHEDALDWEEDSNESAGDTPPRVTPRKESQSESEVNCSGSPEEPWLPCKGSQSTRTSSVDLSDWDEGPQSSFSAGCSIPQKALFHHRQTLGQNQTDSLTVLSHRENYAHHSESQQSHIVHLPKPGEVP